MKTVQSALTCKQ